MKLLQTPINPVIKEIAFQLILHSVVFSFYSINRRNPQIEDFEVVFFLNLSITAFVINYVLLPHFFFKGKYLTFAVCAILAIASALLIEELVLEKIYFPTTRGKGFSSGFYTLVSVLPVITILVGFKFAWDAYGKQKEVNRLKEAVKDSELQFLKLQINPHFLFNNLNNLYSFAIENSPRTPEIILELSAVLRYMLYDCKAEFVPLIREIEQLENFIKISELQIEERGRVNYSFSNKNIQFEIAPLLLMVFVENAFKHSTASQTDNITIDMKLDVDKSGNLEFMCINSFEEQSNIKDLSSGIGLKNVRKRLNLIYPNAHNLVINKEHGRFVVRLTFQLKSIK